MATTNPPIAEIFEVTSSTGFSHDLQQTLYTYQQQAHLTDFTIHVQDTQIHCHRVILSAASPYFEAMLRVGLEEAEKSEVNLDCLDEEILKDLIKYFYTGELKFQYNKLKDLMSACEFLQLQVLKIHLEKYLVGILDDKNCIGWFKVAETYGMDDLAEKATDRMLENFTSVCRHNQFRQLSLAEVIDYIRKKKVQIHSEDTILDACIGWVKADVKQRKKNFCDFLEKVSLIKCSAKHLATVCEEESALFDSAEIKEMLLHGFKGIALSIENPLLDMDNKDEKCLVLYGGKCAAQEANKDIYINADGVWKDLCNMPVEQINVYASMCLLKGELMITGGTKTPTKCHSFSFITRSWNELPDMPTNRHGHASHTVGKYVYIFGGWFDSCKEHNAFVHRYDTVSREWEDRISMNHGVHVPISVQKDSAIYVIQNSNGVNREITNQHGITLQIYDTENNSWKYGASLTDLVATTRGASAAIYKNDLLLLGGEHMICVSYSMQQDAWTLLTQQSNSDRVQLYGAAVVRDDKILLVGGCTDANVANIKNSQDDCVSEFDFESSCWKESEMTCPLKVSDHLVSCIPAYYLMK